MASKSAVIIGGGFYGVNIALYLSQYKNIKDIVILEKEAQLLSRASYVNQARIHNGYHYPRSFTTAYRS
ncbi:MAG: FAD-dependent oxidoreductase, partial [Actinobacillus porcinus]